MDLKYLEIFYASLPINRLTSGANFADMVDSQSLKKRCRWKKKPTFAGSLTGGELKMTCVISNRRTWGGGES